MKHLLILRGEEASGKTSTIRQLMERGFIKPDEIVIKDQVAADLGYTPDTPYTPEVRQKLYDRFRKKSLQALRKQQRAFLEAPFSDEAVILETLDFFAENFDDTFAVSIITLVADFDIRQARARKRECIGFSRSEIDNRVPFSREIQIHTRDGIALILPNVIIDTSKLSKEKAYKEMWSTFLHNVEVVNLTNLFPLDD